MTQYEKKVSVFGDWVKGSDLQSGMKAKIKTEVAPIKSQFKAKDGSDKMQDVCKIHFQGQKEQMNMNLNRPTLDGLIDAFGGDSKNWIDKELTVQTEKAVIGGKRVTIVYLLAEGFELKEDSDGYMKVVKVGTETPKGTDNDGIEYPEEDTMPSDIPF